MTALHICTSDSWGGLELYACALMSELNDAGTNVIAICKPRSRVEEYLVKQGISVFHFPGNTAVSLKSAHFVRTLVEQQRANIVHVHFHKDIWPASFALRKDSERRLFLSIYMGVSSKNDFLHRWIYKRVDAVLTSSLELNNRLPELYPVPKEKIHFFPYGRRLESYVVNQATRKTIRGKLEMNDDQVLAGTMVRIDPEKGVMEFAESFLYLEQELQNRTKYLIVGGPTIKGNVERGESQYEPHTEQFFHDLERFIVEKNLQNRIYLAGFQQDVVGYLSAMDIFVFPSRDEMYSLVVLDAMAMGLPVVAARAGGNLLQVTDGTNGLLYEVKHSQDMAKKISDYIGNPELRAKHGIAAKQFVQESHDMKKTIEQLTRLYGSS